MENLVTPSAELGILSPRPGWLLKPDSGLFHEETSRPSVDNAKASKGGVRSIPHLQSHLQYLIARTPQQASPLDD